MSDELKIVLLAERHGGLLEGLHGLLENIFDSVVMVGDEVSLLETAKRLKPTLAIADLYLIRGDGWGGLKNLRALYPNLKLIVISVHEEPLVRERVLAMGADGFVLKRNLSTDLLPVIESVLAGGHGPNIAITPTPEGA